ncbi:MAG: ATP-grasp domain-containing protein [Gemmatimonadaceae bacterium]|nr:ATP-grasp domain-containing protein [Gemmatimonadaceae bacterium]
MPIAVFVAPILSENASRMIEAVGSLPDVRLGVITQDYAEKLSPPLAAMVAGHWRVDDVLDAGQLSWAAEELTRRLGQIDCLFGAYEQLQVPLAEVREKMGISGMRAAVARRFRDKAEMKDALRAAGLPCAKHSLVETADDAVAFARKIGFPVVVKPPAGAGAISTFRADDEASLREAVAKAAPQAGRAALIEEFVTGDEYSLETISIGGRAVWHSLTQYYPTPLEAVRNPWIQWCVLCPREVDDARYDDIRQVGSRALEVLGMETGLSHMEWFRRRDGTIAISEVAARPPGAQITTLNSRAHDIDFVRAWAEVMVFGTFERPTRKYAVGVAFLRGQGSGKIRRVHGLDQIGREMGSLVVDVKLPTPGQAPAASYEGDGYIILRHPETAVVMRALQRLISVVKVELG